MSEIGKIQDFNEKYGFMIHRKPTMLTRRKLMERALFMQEELDEFVAAAEKADIAEIADALVDLVYLAKGTAVQMGLPWKELFDEVHFANMAKVRGVSKRNQLVDLIKPEGWMPPRIWKIISDHGYDQGAVPVDDPEHMGKEEK